MPDVNEHGFLVDWQAWTVPIAHTLAATEPLTLTDQHFEIIHVIRHFYQTHQHIPSVRLLTKTIKMALGPEKASSVYLHTLFPETLLRTLCKCAGLPKPKHCL
jgi:tRNA 2-thiouridine synthesizing protein E